mgnify:CR=1 FL=1
MTIDLRKDAPNQVSTVNPDQLSKEINTLQEIKQEIENQENKIIPKSNFTLCNKPDLRSEGI